MIMIEIKISHTNFLSAIAARGSVSEVYQRFLPLISSDTVTEKISLWSRLPLANGADINNDVYETSKGEFYDFDFISRRKDIVRAKDHMQQRLNTQ